jgi:hypothetical protein
VELYPPKPVEGKKKVGASTRRLEGITADDGEGAASAKAIAAMAIGAMAVGINDLKRVFLTLAIFS